MIGSQLKEQYVIGVSEIRCPLPVKLTKKNSDEINVNGGMLLSFEQAKRYLIAFYKECLEAAEAMEEDSYTAELSTMDNMDIGECAVEMSTLPKTD